MAAAEDNSQNASGHGYEQCADKEIGGDREGNASIANSAKIEKGDNDQNAHAESHRVR
jgi:hypothetical protein